MHSVRFACILLVASFPIFAQLGPDVGSGAPNGLNGRFIQAYFRNNFNFLTSLPPLGDVKKLGSTGLVQEFPDALKTSGVKYALVRANTNQPDTLGEMDVLQMYPDLYSYYVSLGTTVAGYPVTDTAPCFVLVNQPMGVTCNYQTMDKPAALFVYSNGNTYNTVVPFYTRWLALGGATIAGPATGDQQSVTSSFKTTGMVQTFDQAAIFQITSGNLNTHIFAVGPNVNTLYFANKGYSGVLGFPITDELIQPDGSMRQNFEGGAITYVPGNPAVVKYPVTTITTVPTTSVKMNLGDTLTVQAYLQDANGNPLTDRMIAWSTSNSRVVSVQPSGYTAVLKAAGGGGATIVATSEGKVSSPLAVFVNAPCCSIGEGAPSPLAQQAFQDAVTRNKLTLHLPVATPVRRLANGYVQDVQDAATGAPYLIAVADNSVTGYVIGGMLLGEYNMLGGPSGSAGYPISDATAGGRQLFQNQIALAGHPVEIVAGPFLAKWAGLSYETGAAGPPTSAAMPALSFRATSGEVQSFNNGSLFMATSGPAAGSVYYVGGLIAAAYAQAGGPTGNLGFPIGDEFTSGTNRHQDFEGGFIDYAPGGASAQVHPGTRQPIVQAAPPTVLAGSSVRLAVGGFDPASTVRVSVTGRPDFTVSTTNGAYAWQAIVPAAAKSGTIQIHAVDTASGATADGAYTVRAISDVKYLITKAAGDGQVGQPGATLPQPFVITVRDDGGNPAPGMAIAWAASPGAVLSASSTVTDANGQSRVFLRLQPNDGVALATATAAHTSATFSAQAQHSAFNAFPAMTQSGTTPLGNGAATLAQDGALLTSVAAVVRYYQNTGKLPAPNGFADPPTLNQFLTGFCVFDTTGAQVCDGFIAQPDTQEQFVNLWRAGAFVGGNLDISIEKPDLNTVRDWIAQGAPLVLELAMSANGSYAGAHYVVATGIAADGGIAIMDPNPLFAQTTLNAYAAGFTASSTQWSGTLDQVIRLIPNAPLTPGFLATGKTLVQVSSPAGACGTALKLNPSAANPANGAAPVYATRCDGALPLYQLSSTGLLNSTLTDLGPTTNRTNLTGTGNLAFKVFQSAGVWTAAPQDLEFTNASVVNAASFTPDLAPGSLFSVFGSGLSGPSGTTSIQIGGLPAAIVAQTPFQINGQVPPNLAPGISTMEIASPYGDGQQPVTIQPVAPEVFLIGANQAAVLNQDGTLNTPANPLNRGDILVVFCTGLGAAVPQGQLEIASTPVTVVLAGSAVQPLFAGLTPGFIGLYQVNVQVPLSTPPGLNLSLQLEQGGTAGNTVSVAVQ